MTALDRAAVAAVDSTGQADEILDLYEHLEDAVWRVQSAGLAPVDAAGGLIVAGMGGSAVGGRLSAVFLDDPGAHPRNRLRAELTAEQAAEGAAVVARVHALGETPVERLVSLVLLGDLVSLYLAVLRGEDPVSIPPIDALKAALAER
jgi:hypothetical protein